MFIDFDKKFIFIKTLKTGGTSISKMLRNQYTPVNNNNEFKGFTFYKENALQIRRGTNILNEKIQTGHIEFNLIKKYFCNDIENYFIFSGLRNPFEVELSRILYLANFTKKPSFNSLKISRKVRPIICNTFKHNKYFFSQFIKNTRPYNFMCVYNGEDMSNDHIRLENINEDWERICNKIGINYEKVLHLNSNKSAYNDFNYSKLFSKKNIQLINNKYSEIFKKYEYQLPNKFK